MAKPNMRLAVLVRDVKLITNLIVHEVSHCAVSRTTGRITLGNDTVIDMYLIEDTRITYSGCRMRGCTWDFVWGHQVPLELQAIAVCGVINSGNDYPITLFTE